MNVDDLREKWRNCSRCSLCETRKRVVFGEGNTNADFLIIGEAPGETEDNRGKPFVGDAGRILQDFLDAVGLDREEDCFVTNVVGCRPTAEVEDENGKMRTENRPPSKVERDTCKERLLEIVYRVDPMLIIAVGKVPAASLLGRISTIQNMEGQIYTMHLDGKKTKLRYPVLVVRHTANLSRIVNHKPEGPWGKTLQAFFSACDVVDYMREVYRGIPTPNRREGYDG